MSLRAELIRFGIRALLKRRSPNFDIAEMRRTMQAAERFVPRPPSRCRSTEIEVGGLFFQQVAMPASRAERRVLYLHGGGYVSGSPAHYRHFTWRIADALSANVFALAYRLAPEHPFPAALEDAAKAYDFLASLAADTRELFVMGDSAGGGLTLCLLLKLRDEKRPLPRAAVALSPWTDLALTGCSLAANAAGDPMLATRDLPHCLNRRAPRCRVDLISIFKTRSGAVASAVLVHYAWTGPLRLALAGATRSGTAGVGCLLAIQPHVRPHPLRCFDLPQMRFSPS